MRRISSSWTFFYKRIFPVIRFGFLILFLGVSVFSGQRSLPLLIDRIDQARQKRM